MLLDTHTVIWWALEPKLLSERARKACAKLPENGGCVSSISIWEIGIKIKNKKLEIGATAEDFASRIRKLGYIEIVPIDERIWLKNLALDWNHRDPVDRTLVATALLRNLSIISKDRIIGRYYRRTIW